MKRPTCANDTVVREEVSLLLAEILRKKCHDVHVTFKQLRKKTDACAYKRAKVTCEMLTGKPGERCIGSLSFPLSIREDPKCFKISWEEKQTNI